MENEKFLRLFGKTMENIKIERHNDNYFCVTADTKRFGKNAVMFQGTFEECKRYIKKHGIKLSNCANYNSFSHGYIKKWIRGGTK